MKVYELRNLLLEYSPDSDVLVYVPETKTLDDIKSHNPNGRHCVQLNLSDDCECTTTQRPQLEESPVTSIDQQYPNNLTDPDARAYLENIIGGVHENNAFNGGTWSSWENAQHIVNAYEPEDNEDARAPSWEHFDNLQLADQTEILRVLNLAIENKGPTQ